MANVFWLRGSDLYTPILATGCLPGTTREFVLNNFETTEIDAGLDELKNAEAIFLTSAGLGVIAVDEFEGRAIGSTDHPILRLIPDTK